MCVFGHVCTNAMCRCPNVFSRCFSPWPIYHGIGLMSHQAKLTMTRSVSNG